jgi:hypothetical protein
MRDEASVAGSAGSAGSAAAAADGTGAACAVCNCDLFLSAVVAGAPSNAVCPEHASELGAAPSDCMLLYRCSTLEGCQQHVPKRVPMTDLVPLMADAPRPAERSVS